MMIEVDQQTVDEMCEADERNVETQTVQPVVENSRKLSIIEKIQNFQDLAESMDEPDENEVQELLADITAHGQHVFDWINLLEKNAAELREKARKLGDSARVQENKAKAYKDYLKTALKSAGFEKFPMGDFTLNLVKSIEYLPKSAPTEKDFVSLNEYVDTTFEWKSKPSVMEWVDHKDKIERNFVWKIDIIKAEIKKHQKTLELKKSTDEQKQLAKNELEKLNEIVRTEEKYVLKTVVNKLEK